VIKGFFFSLDQVLEGISCEIHVQEPYFSLLKGIIFVSLIWGFSMFLAFNFFFLDCLLFMWFKTCSLVI
jgi:hypothetical protein